MGLWILMFRLNKSPEQNLLAVLTHHAIDRKHFQEYSTSGDSRALHFTVKKPTIDHWITHHIGEGGTSHYETALREAIEKIEPNLETRVKFGEMTRTGEMPIESVVISSRHDEGKKLLQNVHAEMNRLNNHWGHRLLELFKGVFD
jgi:hypothetical protein